MPAMHAKYFLINKANIKYIANTLQVLSLERRRNQRVRKREELVVKYHYYNTLVVMTT